ncbi:hypothetical protein ABG965_08335 [Enterococcus avium]
MKDAKITANSSKRNIILTREDSQTEYHIVKLEKDRLELQLQIFNNQKKIKAIKLKKVK